MKDSDLDHSGITVRDERIVGEVKQSEEWEAVKMNMKMPKKKSFYGERKKRTENKTAWAYKCPGIFSVKLK